MKTYVLLFLSAFITASDNSDSAHHGSHHNTNVSNTVNITQHRQNRGGRWQGGYPEKHPSIIDAHKEQERQQAEQDAVTCCCFFKIKKKI